MSPTVTVGKSVPHGVPSARGVFGPVVPRQEPSTFGQITKYRSVSIGLPGPTMMSHQPGSSSAS